MFRLFIPFLLLLNACSPSSKEPSKPQSPIDYIAETRLVLCTVVDSMVSRHNTLIKEAANASKAPSFAVTRLIFPDTLVGGCRKQIVMTRLRLLPSPVLLRFLDLYLSPRPVSDNLPLVIRPAELFAGKPYRISSPGTQEQEGGACLKFSHVSTVTFNLPATRAFLMFSYSCGIMCSYSYEACLEKKQNSWKIVYLFLTAQS